MAIGGGLGLVILIVAVLMGADPTKILGVLGEGGGGGMAPSTEAPIDDEAKDFISTVLGDTETVWTELFRQQLGGQYVEPKLILYTGTTPMKSGGVARSATGPFYLPAEQTIYLDLSFFDEMKNRFQAPGDFAQAYVLAHEEGHHVQKLRGLTDRVHSQAGRIPKADYNELSVRLELQADFLAGVWAHHAEKNWRILEQGDVEEALNAANAIGDDRLQKQATGQVVPDAFTHGTSEQRVRWFLNGLKSGRVEDGDATFRLPYGEL